jgi:hypothetical protein
MPPTTPYVGSISSQWDDPSGNVWIITTHMADIGGRIECVGMDVRSFTGTPGDPGDPPHGSLVALKAETIKALPVGKFKAEALDDAQIISHWVAQSPELPRRVRRIAEQRAERLERPSKRGPKAKYGTDFYERVAQAYLSGGRTPIQAVIRTMSPEARDDGHMVSRWAAVEWVKTARELEFLPPAGQARWSIYRDERCPICGGPETVAVMDAKNPAGMPIEIRCADPACDAQLYPQEEQ